MLLLSLLIACVPSRCGVIDALPDEPARVLAIGDSLLAWNSDACQSVVAHASIDLEEHIENRAVNGAQVLGAIPGQYSDDGWDLVVVDGGANDVNRLCECGACDEVLDRLATSDGQQGRMVELVDAITSDGAQVLLLGYYRVGSGAWYGFKHCTETITELDRRYEVVADSRPDVHFFDLEHVVNPKDDGWAYAFDGVHPSPVGAAALGESIAQQARDLR